jgi:hypothetical protein
MRSPSRQKLLGALIAATAAVLLMATPAAAAEHPPTPGPAPAEQTAAPGPAPVAAPAPAQRAPVRDQDRAPETTPAQKAAPAPAPPRRGEPIAAPAPADGQVARIPVGGADTGAGTVAEQGADAGLLVVLGGLGLTGAAGAVALRRRERRG